MRIFPPNCLSPSLNVLVFPDFVCSNSLVAAGLAHLLVPEVDLDPANLLMLDPLGRLFILRLFLTSLSLALPLSVLSL